MKNNTLKVIGVLFAFFATSLAHAATDWSTQDYDLYSGDFNGDGKTDILYIAKDPAKPSGIATSDGTGPNISFQSWPSNYLGIQWYGGLYVAIVGDFNHDGKSDVLLQRTTPGDSYLLLADSSGRLTGISQTISNGALGLNWSKDQHVILAGDFNGDGRADLFLQAKTSSGTNAIVLADSNGTFTSGPAQTWTDSSWGAFKWSTANAVISVGDFNGDGKADLLIQAKPKIVMIDYDVSIPVPVYAPNSFGVVLSQGGSTPFVQAGVQQWSRNANGVDWSPNFSNTIVGDFDGDGRADVILQAKNSNRQSYLLTGNASGTAFSLSTSVSANVAITSDNARLISGNFDGTGGTGLYIQSTSASGSNFYTNTVGATITATTHDPSAVTGVVPATAVGKTTGSFAVSGTGAATYTIPIVVPPGVADMQPRLALTYSSSSGNGLLGIGWAIGGMSAISRCPQSVASDGATSGITLTYADSFCLDGNKLRVTSGSYGQDGSQYRTEIESFSRITSFGTAGNGPAYFVVEGKDGLSYRYGYNADSRIEVVGTSSARTWALDKVTDRSGNYLTISYIEDSTNGGYRPNEINYAANDSAGLAPTAKVSFVWENRPSSDVLTSYFAGGVVNEYTRLNRIETRYNNALVRKYQLSYNANGTTLRSRLASVQECEGSTGTCLSPTMISWQDGQQGFGAEVDTGISAGTAARSTFPIDINGDGRPDLIADGSTWGFALANPSGGFGPWVNTGINGTLSFHQPQNPQYGTAVPIDALGNGQTGILMPNTSGSWPLLLWNGSTFVQNTVTIPLPWRNGPNGTRQTTTVQPAAWIADIDGDGLADIVYEGQDWIGVFITVLFNAGGGNFVARSSWTAYRSSGLTSAANFADPLAKMQSGGRVGDFNHDGRTEVFIYQIGVPANHPGKWLLLSPSYTGQSGTFALTSTITGVGSGTNSIWMGDSNGDGISDLIYNAAGTVYSCPGTGAGIGGCTQVPPYPIGGGAVVIDWDGDGRTDLLMPDSYSNWILFLSTGSSYLAGQSAGISGPSSIMAVDVNGDGLADIMYADPNTGNLKYRLHSGAVPDLVTAVTDGFGNNVSIAYAPLTDGSVYTKGSQATFPEVDVQAPLQVVKSYSLSDGVGGNYSVGETYAGARIHLQGRGFEGFASRSETDSRTGIKATITYKQLFPFTGQVDSTTTIQPNGKTISFVQNAYSDLVTNSVQYSDRHLPYLSGSTQTSYEVSADSPSLDGSPIKQVASSVTAIDAYGNPTNVILTTTDLTGSGLVYTSQTAKSYLNDEPSWCLGFVTQQQVTNTIPNAMPLEGNAAPTRTVSFDPDPDLTKCRPAHQTIEPNTSLQVVTGFDYDTFGHAWRQTVTATGMSNRVTTVDYGPLGVLPVSLTNAAGEMTSKTYDYSLGVLLTATDANGIQVGFVYDGFGRKLQENAPDGTITRWTLFSCGLSNAYCGDSVLRYQVQEQKLDSSASHNAFHTDIQMYDAFGRAVYKETQGVSGAMSIVRSIYNTRGLLYQQSTPYYAGTSAAYSTYTYDLLNRLYSIQRQTNDADTSTATTQYTYARLTQFVTDALSHSSTQVKNAIGQVVQTLDANGNTTQFAYDATGNLARTTDPNSNQITNVFNVVGFKKGSQDPDMGAWSYDYYPTGELKTQTDAKGQVTSFTYDLLSRLTYRAEAEGTTSFVYGSSAGSHNIGRIQSVSSPGYSESHTYDSIGRPQTNTYNEDAAYQVDYSYNNQGSLDTLTYPTSTSGYRLKLQYAYSYGMATQVRDFAAGTQFWTLNATNAAGQPIDEVLANGVRSITGYDSITGAMNYRQSGSGGSTTNIQNLSYQWDKVGNLLRRQDSIQSLTEVFAYDSLNRIDYSTLNGSTNLDVTVDPIGNLTYKSDVGTIDYTTAQTGCSYYAYSQPHAARKAGSNIYCYDANGNMTSRQGSAISWTSYNMPSQINSGSNSSQFYYGASRQRWKQVANYGGTTETTIYVAGMMEKVTRSGGTTDYRHYISAGGTSVIYTRRSDGSSGTYYLSSDHLGSSDAITDSSGTVLVRESFAAYGGRRGSNWTGAPSAADQNQFTSITRHGFTGHEELDNLNLIHMNGRVYDPLLGRFLSADPFVQSPLNLQSFNRYSYVMNGPMSATDPTGFFSLGNLLNPFSRDNPIGPFGSVGKYLAAAALLPLASPFMLSENQLIAFSVALTYEINKPIDRFLAANPDLQQTLSIFAQMVAVAFPALWWVPVAVDAHFSRINGGSPKDIIRSAVIAVAVHYALTYLSQDWSESDPTAARPGGEEVTLTGCVKGEGTLPPENLAGDLHFTNTWDLSTARGTREIDAVAKRALAPLPFRPDGEWVGYVYWNSPNDTYAASKAVFVKYQEVGSCYQVKVTVYAHRVAIYHEHPMFSYSDRKDYIAANRALNVPGPKDHWILYSTNPVPNYFRGPNKIVFAIESPDLLPSLYSLREIH